MRPRVFFAVLALALGACGDPGSGSPEGTTTTTTVGSTTTSEGEIDDESTVVEKAIQDLTSRLGVPSSDIEVVQVRDVQWPDGALGCPEEGKMYTQAVVDGTQVLLGHDERIYDYHTGEDDEPFLCPSDEKDGGYDFLPPPGSP